MDLRNGDCLELMKTIPDKSVDLFLCDLPYGETNCKWDTKIDMVEFWKEFKRIRKSPKVACIHFCSTKFGYTLIKSWEKGFKMDLVWKKRNKTGGLQSKYRPMRNHEMIYFFYDQAPKYNRDKYHKRIHEKVKTLNNTKGNITNAGMPEGVQMFDKKKFFEPPNPVSVVEEKYTFEKDDNNVYGSNKKTNTHGTNEFEPPNPASIVESDKVFIGKRNHQTEKPIDVLEFILKYWTNEDDVVLDPTMGSGSTGVACKNLNRKFIGFELDPKIFEVAIKRIK